MGDKFIEMCNTLIHTLPIFSKIDISIKFESEPLVINIGDYIVLLQLNLAENINFIQIILYLLILLK